MQLQLRLVLQTLNLSLYNPYAQPKKLSSIAQPKERSNIDSVSAQELTNTTLGGRGIQWS